jgi:hypothetical protein
MIQEDQTVSTLTGNKLLKHQQQAMPSWFK